MRHQPRRFRISALLTVACCCGALLVTAVHAALVYDLSADWTAGNNPSGAWTYGAYGSGGSGGTLDPSTFTRFTAESTTLVPGLDIWWFGGDPNIEKNLTGADILAYDIDWVSGQVAFGPQFGPTVARWTAPASGLYDIAVTYMTIQKVNSPPSAYVYVGLTEVFDQALTAVSGAQFGTPASYAASNVLLAAGQTVDFVVFGDNRLLNKTTEVDATITLVPEPALAGLLALGGLLLAGRRLPRR